jgi:hypothetical protein
MKTTLKEVLEHLIKEENSAVDSKRSDEWLEGFGHALEIVKNYIKEV